MAWMMKQSIMLLKRSMNIDLFGKIGMDKGQRKSNIELLRIFVTCFVIVLHYNNSSLGGALAETPYRSSQYMVLLLLEAVAICAVDVFVVISGYFLSKSNERYLGRGFVLILHVIFFNVIDYLITIVFGNRGFNVKSFLLRLVPSNWFVVIYIAMYYISPLLNLAFNNIPLEKNKRQNGIISVNKTILLLGLILLFCVWPSFVDIMYDLTGYNFIGLSTIGAFDSGKGYTITNFVVCYLVGNYISFIENEIIIKRKHLFIIFLICVGVLFCLMYYEISVAYYYYNPIIVLNSAILFIIFLKTKINNKIINKMINKLSSCTMTVYLIHISVLPYLGISSYANRNVLIMMFHIMLCIVIIFLIGFVSDRIYKLLMKKPNSMLVKIVGYRV